MIAAAVAVFAAVLAIRATALLARTVLAEGTADHEGPPRRVVRGLSVQAVHGKTRRDVAADTRDYSFTVAIANRSGADRRLVRIELRVTFRTRANFLGAVDLTSEQNITVGAGKSIEATLRFTTSNVIPRHCRVDAYTLLLTDDRGERLVADASLPAVLQADTDGVGPATWGWD
ncbi:MAG TPA: hypothetical protein VL173_12030 [Vicinamibacterales bacterium]|nr:hypothetical protein [Vicinamibacterales bacterium]